ncbi:MAG: sigma-70 family RNA polymerase sigma factor [Pseudomonadota bacterium]
MSNPGEVTQLLQRWSRDNSADTETLTALIYDELQKIAYRLFQSESAAHTLQPTALVHEAFERLVDVDVSWQDRAHFYALAARMMRRLLINHAEKRNAQKRGGDEVRVTLDESAISADEQDVTLLELEGALQELSNFDPRKAELIELQYFGGLSTEEMAVATDMSVSSVGRDLRFARAWLRDHLTQAS